jgi:hypothetical protein
MGVHVPQHELRPIYARAPGLPAVKTFARKLAIRGERAAARSPTAPRHRSRIRLGRLLVNPGVAPLHLT